jgi:predicted ABC-type ATPase
MNLAGDPTLYLFAGSNGAGKTTFAKAYLRQLDPIPRFLNADEIARGLSPLAPANSPSKPANSCSTKSKAA